MDSKLNEGDKIKIHLFGRRFMVTAGKNDEDTIIQEITPKNIHQAKKEEQNKTMSDHNQIK